MCVPHMPAHVLLCVLCLCTFRTYANNIKCCCTAGITKTLRRSGSPSARLDEFSSKCECASSSCLCLLWIRPARGWGPLRRQWKCVLVVRGPVIDSNPHWEVVPNTQCLSEETTCLGFSPCSTLMACPWPWKAKEKRDWGFGLCGSHSAKKHNIVPRWH